MSKECNRCGKVKPLEDFNKNSRAKDGHIAQCKSCKAEYRRVSAEKIKAQKLAWYEKNTAHVAAKGKQRRVEKPEECRKADRAKYLNNREAILERVSQYQKDRPEVGRQAGRKYRKANPDKQCVKAARRRAKKARATPAWALDDEWELFYAGEVYHLARLRKQVLGRDFHVDHIVPITSDLVCGLHISQNLCVLDGLENVRKSNRFWPDMWQPEQEHRDNN